MKRLLIALALLLLPFTASATPVSWDYTTNLLQPLQSGWNALVKASNYQATSTTASIFPYASTTVVSAALASSTAWRGGGLESDCDIGASSKLLWDATTGRFSCGTDQTGGGSSFAYPFPSNATSTVLTFSNGASIPKLTNLTTNGFVKTSSGDGTLIVDTTTYESGLTAGDGLTRTADDFDCDTASGSVFGCLSAANWTTFNNKQATISVTWPITLSGATLGFAGLATTSPWTAGQLAYVNSGNTVTSVATGTVSGTNGITVTAGRSAVGGALAIDCTVATKTVAGCLAATDFNIFNNKIGTSSVLTNGQLLVAGPGGNTAYSIATSSATCSGGTSCSAFTVVGSVAPAITSFTYPFPASATSSPLTLTGLLTITNASTTMGSFSYASSTDLRAGKFSGAGLTDCDTAATSKLLWDTTTGLFSCGTDQTGGSTVASSSAFSGTAPGASWTDLNLSSIVGANKKVVLLSLFNGSNTCVASFRQRGDSALETSITNATLEGINKVNTNATTNTVTTIVATDLAGFIQWKTNANCAAGGTTVLEVRAYW